MKAVSDADRSEIRLRMAEDVRDVGLLALSLLYGADIRDVADARHKLQNSSSLRHLSDDCRGLLCKMLLEDPFNRISAKKALMNSWFCQISQ